MARNVASCCPADLLKRLPEKSIRVGICETDRLLTIVLLAFALLACTYSSQAVLLWSDLGDTQVHETGPGVDILGGV